MRVKEGNKEKDILEGAIKVFAKDGYHNAKISKIAEVAGVATGSVYVYFENKEDVLLKIFEHLWKKLYEELLSLADKSIFSPTEKIDAMIDLAFDVFTTTPELAEVFVNEQHHIQKTNKTQFTDYYEKFLSLGEEFIQDGIQKKIIHSSIDVKILRYFILGAIRNLLQSWLIDPKTFPLNKIRQNVKYLIKYGIQK
jgi:TetR/AcrR family transcriptional regulator, fatty acid metabolism regulator protein